MIGKSLANDFQYTKLKYKQYLYFSLNIPLMFLLCFLLFSLLVLQLKGCAQYSLLVIQISSRSQISSRISSRGLVNVNCKYAIEEICPVLLK